MSYDSKADTLEHIRSVSNKINTFIKLLVERAQKHDNSKLGSPEKELFDKYTPILKELTYGSEEYKDSLEQLKPALDHHYAVNPHHPEHYHNGIDGMNLIDIVEMYCDWLAAIERTKDGSIKNSLSVNKDRFNISPQLISIFTNTYYQFGKL